jgi:hypothetical protein
MRYNPVLCDLKSLLVILKLIHLEQYKNLNPKIENLNTHTHTFL